MYILGVITVKGTNVDYRCEDRKKVGEFRGDIGAVR
jgi:hypothetical protein